MQLHFGQDSEFRPLPLIREYLVTHEVHLIHRLQRKRVGQVCYPHSRSKLNLSYMNPFKVGISVHCTLFNAVPHSSTAVNMGQFLQTDFTPERGTNECPNPDCCCFLLVSL